MKLEAAQAESVLLGEACHFLGIAVEWFNKILTQRKVWTRIWKTMLGRRVPRMGPRARHACHHWVKSNGSFLLTDDFMWANLYFGIKEIDKNKRLFLSFVRKHERVETGLSAVAPCTRTWIFVVTGLSFNTGCFGIIWCLCEVSDKLHHCQSSDKSPEWARMARNTKMWESAKK